MGPHLIACYIRVWITLCFFWEEGKDMRPCVRIRLHINGTTKTIRVFGISSGQPLKSTRAPLPTHVPPRLRSSWDFRASGPNYFEIETTRLSLVAHAGKALTAEESRRLSNPIRAANAGRRVAQATTAPAPTVGLSPIQWGLLSS